MYRDEKGRTATRRGNSSDRSLLNNQMGQAIKNEKWWVEGKKKTEGIPISQNEACSSLDIRDEVF